MNCIQFEQRVHNLVLETIAEGALDEALAHAESCAGCAHLLAEARALRSGLRSLAEDGPQQAPPRLEAMLLAAFRRQRRAEIIRARQKRWALIGMAAAALLAALAVRQWRGGSGQGAARGTAVEPAQPRNAASEAAAANAATKAPSSSRPWPRRSGPPRTSGKAAPKHRATPEPQRPQRPASSAGEIEWATDFLPLPDAEGAASPDAGELVRVDLPRSALAALGLPPPEDAAEQTITAQVFIGEDGVARAIRFAR